LKFFMPTIRGLDVGTKKRYAGLIRQHDKLELLFKGLENVRTDWTQLAKDFQYQLYSNVFHEQPVVDYITSTVEQLHAGQVDDKLIYRKRIRRKLHEYVKNVPPHVKAARHADTINEKQGKSLQYQKKGWIEYVMTLNGPQVLKYVDSPIDYDFYHERQLKAVADAILPFIQLSFDQITDNQMNLF
jgi:DNA polymerase II